MLPEVFCISTKFVLYFTKLPMQNVWVNIILTGANADFTKGARIE